MSPQLVVQPLSKATIQTTTLLQLSRHSYASIKAKTDVSAGSIFRIHWECCSEAAVSSGGHPTKPSDINITCTKKLFCTNKIKTAV